MGLTLLLFYLLVHIQLGSLWVAIVVFMYLLLLEQSVIINHTSHIEMLHLRAYDLACASEQVQPEQRLVECAGNAGSRIGRTRKLCPFGTTHLA